MVLYYHPISFIVGKTTSDYGKSEENLFSLIHSFIWYKYIYRKHLILNIN